MFHTYSGTIFSFPDLIQNVSYVFWYIFLLQILYKMFHTYSATTFSSLNLMYYTKCFILVLVQHFLLQVLYTKCFMLILVQHFLLQILYKIFHTYSGTTFSSPDLVHNVSYYFWHNIFFSRPEYIRHEVVVLWGWERFIHDLPSHIWRKRLLFLWSTS